MDPLAVAADDVRCLAIRWVSVLLDSLKSERLSSVILGF